MRITRPTATDCHSCGTEMIRRPLVSTAMMSAPMTVPMMEPLPPWSDVPPMTTAAMASSSSPMPPVGWAELRREADSTPARPMNRPDIA